MAVLMLKGLVRSTASVEVLGQIVIEVGESQSGSEMQDEISFKSYLDLSQKLVICEFKYNLLYKLSRLLKNLPIDLDYLLTNNIRAGNSIRTYTIPTHHHKRNDLWH